MNPEEPLDSMSSQPSLGGKGIGLGWWQRAQGPESGRQLALASAESCSISLGTTDMASCGGPTHAGLEAKLTHPW